MSGGAYGGFCRFDPRSGDFKYLSYRDPNLGQTLETYDGAPAFLKDLELGEDELVKVRVFSKKLGEGVVGWLNMCRISVSTNGLSLSLLPFPHHRHASSSC